jgi:fibronectin-binding autotransporter adhesin
VISGTGALTKQESSTLTLSGTNTYSGITTLNAGIISVAASAGLGATPGSADADNITFTGGTLKTTAGFTLGTNKGITLSTGGGSINVDSGTTLTYGGIITGSTAFTKLGTGTLTLSGVNDYTGITTIDDGTISISAATGLGATPDSADADNIILAGGTLNTSASFTLGTNKGITLSTGGGTIKVDSGTTLTYGGIIAGSTAFTKSGSGTLTLSGNSSYAADTNVSAGTLSVTGRLYNTLAVGLH